MKIYWKFPNAIWPSGLRLALITSFVGLTACTELSDMARSALPANASPETEQLAALKDDLDTLDLIAGAGQPVSIETNPSLTAIGFAQVATQPGSTLNEKRLLALRAARVDAMRLLAEQVHGLRIDATTTISDAAISSDTIRATVDGTIRGARTLRITPKGSDGYEVELQLDRDTVGYLIRAARGRA